jgi:hypothetical protein
MASEARCSLSNRPSHGTPWFTRNIPYSTATCAGSSNNGRFTHNPSASSNGFCVYRGPLVYLILFFVAGASGGFSITFSSTTSSSSITSGTSGSSTTSASTGYGPASFGSSCFSHLHVTYVIVIIIFFFVFVVVVVVVVLTEIRIFIAFKTSTHQFDSCYCHRSS